MAKDLNKVMLIGRLTRDPETRTTPSGQTVCNFGLATGRQWKDAEGATQSQTEFHNIVTWSKLAEISQQYLNKGKQIFVEGRLQTRNWVGQQDNVKRYRTEIIADNIIFLGSSSSSTASRETQESSSQEADQQASQDQQNQASAPQEQKSENE